LTIINGWADELIDVKGAFLCGNFNGEKPIYMKVPEGFERYYPDSMCLLLLQTIYGLKQAARAFGENSTKHCWTCWTSKVLQINVCITARQ